MIIRSFFVFAALLGAVRGDVRAELEPFLDQHCYSCHDDFDAEADLNLLDMKFDPTDPGNLATWKDVFHRVEAGEMPPKKKERPEAEAMAAFLEAIEKPLMEAELADLEKNGRVHSRRLTREEYEYSLHDLLGVDIPLSPYLTAEAEDGFESSYQNQQVSHFHLDSYLRASDIALEEAFQRAMVGDETFKKRYPPRVLTGRSRGNYRGPEMRGGKVVSWTTSVLFYGRMTNTVIPKSGWYRVTVENVDAVNPGEDGVVWGTVHSGSGFSDEPLLYPVGLIEATGTPTTRSFEGWIQKGHILVLRPAEGGKKSARLGNGGSVNYEGRDLEKEGNEGIRFGGIEIERIYPNAKQWEVRSRLFPGMKGPEIRTGGAEPEKALAKAIYAFANRAFRRPVKPEELEAYRELALSEYRKGKDFAGALRGAYHAILCSPHFLTFVEKPGKLDEFALASRLSYLLWKSVPDGKLRNLAKAGTLSEAKVLKGEIARMLADAKAERFIESFTDQWLDLRNINFTQPDPKRFRNFDFVAQESMLAESRAFVAELIKEDLSVKNLLRSDFAFLNTRLKSHYGLRDTPVTPGEGLQRVQVDAAKRSGLLMQGAILKVTADGSVTSPVVRGVWINERILGRHIPPPPPNIPAVEPDIRGAVSIRDQLAKHSTQASCASCHAKIDPSGFALESFDPIGQYRTRYGAKPKSAAVDPSGVTPDGAAFRNFEGWRKIYLDRPEMLARNFATQLLRYGTGGEIYFSDRETLDRVVERSAEKDYGLRSIIEACVLSPIFQNK
ncbi:MAG: DUF1592 domain-containing protein [Verrucomicrobiaceae bacterium]